MRFPWGYSASAKRAAEHRVSTGQGESRACEAHEEKVGHTVEPTLSPADLLIKIRGKTIKKSLRPGAPRLDGEKMNAPKRGGSHSRYGFHTHLFFRLFPAHLSMTTNYWIELARRSPRSASRTLARLFFSWPLLLALGAAFPIFAAATVEEAARAVFDQQNPFELQLMIASLPPGQPLDLLYRGYLAASWRETENAVSALTEFSQDSAAPLLLRAQAVEILAGVLVREGRYAEAVKWLEKRLANYTSVTDEEKRKNSEQTLSVARVLASAAHQQTLRRTASSVARTRDKVGLSNIAVTINETACKAVFDTGANFCVATESAAKRLGLSELTGAVEVQAATGKVVPGRMAMAKSLLFGDCEFRDVAFLVFKDEASPSLKSTMPSSSSSVFRSSCSSAAWKCERNQSTWSTLHRTVRHPTWLWIPSLLTSRPILKIVFCLFSWIPARPTLNLGLALPISSLSW